MAKMPLMTDNVIQTALRESNALTPQYTPHTGLHTAPHRCILLTREAN
jgi:hypothetical protein